MAAARQLPMQYVNSEPAIEITGLIVRLQEPNP